MTDQLHALQNDIGFLKSLAESGRNQGLAGGSMLMAAGGVFGLASVGHWAINQGLIPTEGGWAYAGVWGAAAVLFGGALVIAKRRMGAASTDSASRAGYMAWQALGWTIFVLIVCMQLVVWRTHSMAPLALFPAIILSLYGSAWLVAASIARRSWMWAASLSAYAAAIGASWLCTNNLVYLWYAAALWLVVALPGALMIRATRAGT